MASTTFVDGTTPVIASWLNDVNTVTYTTVPAHTNTLNSGVVLKDSSTGAAALPAGTTAQRPSVLSLGQFRYNTTLSKWEGYDGSSWGSIGGSGTGGGTDIAFFEGDSFISTSFEIGSTFYTSGVTVTIASPAVFTLNNHGYVEGTQLHMKTTGALPTGLAVDTPLYVIATGLTSTTFQVSLTQGGAAVNTSGTQSGVHSIGKLKNAVSAGPVTIGNAATVTIPNGATWSITA